MTKLWSVCNVGRIHELIDFESISSMQDNGRKFQVWEIWIQSMRFQVLWSKRSLLQSNHTTKIHCVVPLPAFKQLPIRFATSSKVGQCLWTLPYNLVPGWWRCTAPPSGLCLIDSVYQEWWHNKHMAPLFDPRNLGHRSQGNNKKSFGNFRWMWLEYTINLIIYRNKCLHSQNSTAHNGIYNWVIVRWDICMTIQNIIFNLNSVVIGG